MPSVPRPCWRAEKAGRRLTRAATPGGSVTMIDVVRIARLLLLIALLGCVHGVASAEVTRVEIASRADVLDGKPFGDAGPYEKIVGKVFFAVDPNHPANKHIVDVDKAPRDAAGRVLFSADLYVLQPKD